MNDEAFNMSIRKFFKKTLNKSGLSFPRKRESMFYNEKWIPAFAGKTLVQRFLKSIGVQSQREIAGVSFTSNGTLILSKYSPLAV